MPACMVTIEFKTAQGWAVILSCAAAASYRRWVAAAGLQFQIRKPAARRAAVEIINKNHPRCLGPRGSDIIERAECSLFYRSGLVGRYQGNKPKDRYPMIRSECADS